MKLFLALLTITLILGTQHTSFAAIACKPEWPSCGGDSRPQPPSPPRRGLRVQGFVPKVAFYCEAQGYKADTLQSVIGGMGVNPTEAADMAMDQCEAVYRLESCEIVSCWSEDI